MSLSIRDLCKKEKSVLNFSLLPVSFPSLSPIKNLREIPGLSTSGSDPKSDIHFIIIGKLDGFPIQIHLTKDRIRFGDGTRFFEEEENYYGYKELIYFQFPFMKIMEELQKELLEDQHITFFGTLFGKSISSAVYFQDKSWLFSDLAINGKIVSPSIFYQIMQQYDLGLYAVNMLYSLDLRDDSFLPDGFQCYYGNALVKEVILKPFFEAGQNYLYSRKTVPPVPYLSEPMQASLLYYLTKERIFYLFANLGIPNSKNQIRKKAEICLQRIIAEWKQEHIGDLKWEQVSAMRKNLIRLIETILKTIDPEITFC